MQAKIRGGSPGGRSETTGGLLGLVKEVGFKPGVKERWSYKCTTYYVNCSLMLRVCNMWQFRHHFICFFSFVFSLYLLHLFFSCLLPINLVNKVDYSIYNSTSHMHTC